MKGTLPNGHHRPCHHTGVARFDPDNKRTWRRACIAAFIFGKVIYTHQSRFLILYLIQCQGKAENPTLTLLSKILHPLSSMGKEFIANSIDMAQKGLLSTWRS